MTTTETGRLPLTAARIVSTFGLTIVGLMCANLMPFMILAIQDSFGIGVTEAGTLMTACLLSTAAGCLLVTRFTEGRGRYLVARVGLAATAVGFGVAAADIAPLLSGAGIILGGLGAGGALAAGGAALSALRNPNRVSGVSGLSNRGLITVVLAVIPVVGIGMLSAFGAVAALAALLSFTVGWLPMVDPDSAPAPAVAHTAADDPALTGAIVTTRTGTRRVRTPTRTITIAGFALLVMFAVWAVAEDSLWAMSGAIGISQAGMTEEQLGLVLSASTGGGLVAAAVLVFVGARLGRALPLGILLALGGTLKIIACVVTDPTAYLFTMIAWNTVYSIVFMFILATAAALDASGRWSGPVLGVYLIGSSLAPLFGAGISEAFGFPTLGWVLGLMSFALLVPLAVVGRISSRVEHEHQNDRGGSPEIEIVRTTGA